MVRENEVIKEVLDNGNIKRWMLNSITASGGNNQRLTEDSKIVLHNTKILLDGEGNDIGASYEDAQNTFITIREFLERLNVTWEQFALVWADIIDEKLNVNQIASESIETI